MGPAMRRTADVVETFAALAKAPYRFDFYQALRTLECLHADQPRWGQALRPRDEPVRLGQDPDLSFAPAPLASFDPGVNGAPPRLQVRLFGLFGPNGPLPVHLTEYARERLRHAGDATLSRFLDLFHHRFLTLFYRAWSQAQPHVNHDRPESDRFTVYVGSFVGMAPDALRHRDAVPDAAKLFHAGNLIRHVRNAAGLRAILQQFFSVPVGIDQFVGHWMALSVSERTRLAGADTPLGAGAVLGTKVWDRQHKFRIRLGPLTLNEYQTFLPGGTNLRRLADWVRLYTSLELEWDARLVLRRDEVPGLALDGRRQLGWTTWLGCRRAPTDAEEVCVQADRFV